MNRAGAREGHVPENGEDFVEISQTDAAPGRSTDEVNCVAKNGPAEIGAETSVAGAEIEALKSLAAKEGITIIAIDKRLPNTETPTTICNVNKKK